MQTDQIIELRVITGDGNELTCSATSNPDLFNGVRAGLGQCGIITQATLRLVRAPERVRRYQLFYRDLASLTSDQRRVLTEQRFDQVQGRFSPMATVVGNTNSRELYGMTATRLPMTKPCFGHCRTTARWR